MWAAVIGVAFATRDANPIFWTALFAFFGSWIIADRGLKTHKCSHPDDDTQ